MNELSPQLLIKDSFKLFSLPDIYFQIAEMINDPRFTASDMGKVISIDPGLSARLLKVVNSSFYGFQARIDTISRAITIIGTEDLHALVLATTVIDKFSNIPSELVNMTDYWLRCVHTGIIAKLLAKKTAVLHSERLFMTGLLHDIGSLILYSKLPEKSRDVLLSANNDRRLVGGLEQEIIGFTHADVGAALIKSWGLPESLYEAVACYLNPDLAQAHKLDAYLLYLASRLTDISQQYDSVDKLLIELSNEGLSIIRLDTEQILAVKKQADEEFTDIFELMAPGKSFH
ncbi:MAG: HDOD domain-containing protein [Methylococcales bacterium]|nr:HDOD domain-containing protein [Methylococcales bacterium]